MPRFALFLVLGMALLAGAAWAGNSKATALASQAERFFKAQKFQDAAETLLKAYELDPVPLYLHNIGRAYEQLGELELALDYFGKYVNLPPAKTDAAVVKAVLERYPSLAPDAKSEPARKPAAPRPTLEPEQTPGPTEPALESNPPAAPPISRTTLVVISGSIAVAGLGTALGCALGARGDKAAFRDAVTLSDKQKYEASTRTMAAITDVSLLLGVAAAVTTVILFPFPSAPSSPSVSVTPLSGGAMAQMGVSF